MESLSHLLIGLFGGLLGSIVIAFVKNKLEKSKIHQLKYKELMEEKYRYILIIMACILDYTNRNIFSVNEQTPAKSSEEYFFMLKGYYYHGLLYSSDEIIVAIKTFIENPCLKNYVKTAVVMRRDLWSKKTRLKYENIALHDFLELKTNND